MAALRSIGRVLATSYAYQSRAVGPAGQPDFVNAAALLETDLPPAALRTRLRQVEADLGRVRSADKFAPRSIDLDLVLYDDVVEGSPEMTLPDPDLMTRPYLAVTVAELAPGALHPVSHTTLAENARRLGGSSGLVRRADIDFAQPPPSSVERGS